MSSLIGINKSRLIILTLAAVVMMFFATKVVFSQTPSPAASTTGLNFPIAELGGCTNLESCTNYCEDPVNYNSCSNFAKKNGFYKDDETLYGDDKFWQETQKELGCNSAESCLDYCSRPENLEKCDAYAKRNEIPGGYTDQPDKPEYLQIAQATLGCNSLESCSTVCDNPANAQKCSEFANRVGLLGGNTSEGPGGCQNPESCIAFCSDPANFDQCSPYAPGGGTFSGPGGCNSETSCRSYCDRNPDECRSLEPGSSGVYVPITCPQGEYHGPGGVCTAINDTRKAADCVGADKYWNGESCLAKVPFGVSSEIPNAHFEGRPEMGNCSNPGKCYDYCKTNPSSCPGFDQNASRPTDEYNPYLYYTPGTDIKFEPKAEMGNCDSPGTCYDYCKENPGKCEGFS